MDHIVGVPGALSDPLEPPSHYVTKVGGVPAYPGHQPPSLQQEEQHTCGCCRLPMSLVLQVRGGGSAADAGSSPDELHKSRRHVPCLRCLPTWRHHPSARNNVPCVSFSQPPPTTNKPVSGTRQAYAPLSAAEHGVDVPERVLHVWACVHPSCGRGQGSWKAVRAQLCSQQQPAAAASSGSSSCPAPSPPPAGSQATKPAEPGQRPSAATPDAGYGGDLDMDGGDDWGFGDGGFGAGEAGGFGATNSGTAGGFDFSDLDAALEGAAAAVHKAKAVPSGAAATAAAALQEAAAAGPIAELWQGAGSCAGRCGGPELPAFCLLAEEEPRGAYLHK